jgi:hypothetical protein
MMNVENRPYSDDYCDRGMNSCECGDVVDHGLLIERNE